MRALFLALVLATSSIFAAEIPMKAEVDVEAFSDATKETITGFGFPSGRHLAFTAPASGGTWTPPANGWVHVNATATAQWGYINLNGSPYLNSVTAMAQGQVLYNTIPVSKNRSVIISYDLVENINAKFIYAEGN
jgi:hypothetical protein